MGAALENPTVTLAGINEWLDALGKEGASSFELIKKDLSSREYYRLTSASESMVLCSAETAVNEDFIAVCASLYTAGVSVPRIIAFHSNKNWLLQSDAGRRNLSEVVQNARKSSADILPIYRPIMEQLARIPKCSIAEPVKDRRFDTDKLTFEMDFFETKVREVSDRVDHNLFLPFEFQMFLKSVCQRLDSATPQIFCHRDFHSKNILFGTDGVTVIDFQDARSGLPWYDLASILYDPYSEITQEERKALMELYLDATGFYYSENLFYLQALQRTIKAMGSYLHGILLRGEKQYLEYFSKAAGYLEEIVQIGGFPDHSFLVSQDMQRLASRIHARWHKFGGSNP